MAWISKRVGLCGALLGVVAVVGAVACTNFPQEVTVEGGSGNYKVKAKWDGYVITVSGLENALSEVTDYLDDALDAHDQAAIDAWTNYKNQILLLKQEALQDVTPVPDTAYLQRPTEQSALLAYSAYRDAFEELTMEALQAGIPTSELLSVKSALLGS